MIARTLAIAAALGMAAAAVAQTASTTDKTATATTTSKPTLGPSKHVVNKTTNTTATSMDASGHMATTKTKTGKTITYDCSKADNKTKAVCKGK